MEVLLAAVESHSVCERWASVQCLAVTGVAPAPVVAELIAQLMGSYDQQRRERAAELLARLSGKTVRSGLSLVPRRNAGGKTVRSGLSLVPRRNAGCKEWTASRAPSVERAMLRS